MILVTGATGLVGTHLLTKLVQEKQPIRALYRSDIKKKHAKKVFSYHVEKQQISLFDNIEWIKADITDIAGLSNAFENITHVYHCAAWITFNPKNNKKLRKVNIEGTANVVNLCLIHDIKKLCYVSSIATLEENPDDSFIDEDTEWNPETQKSIYAITKYGAELEVWRGAQENLDVVIVNPGIIIGPGFFNGGSGFLFKRIYRGMKYYTTGTTGYIAVNDVVDIMHLLMKSHFKNERYILIAENVSYKNAFSMIATSLGKKAPTKKATLFLLKIAYYMQLVSHFCFRTKRSIFKSSIKSAITNSRYKNDKIKKALNYNFTPIETAIKETATFFLKK